jgi:hypothetical protein
LQQHIDALGGILRRRKAFKRYRRRNLAALPTVLQAVFAHSP